MSTIVMPKRPAARPPRRRPEPPLENGDRLDQPTFHARYAAMPPGTRAELIEGVVYMASPVSEGHSEEHARAIGWLTLYQIETPGLALHDNATVILSDGSEPQPDVVLRIPGRGTRSERVGQTTYIAGPPELVVEVASSSESIDLNGKLRDYERHGVNEYVVFLVLTRQVRWFVRDGGRFVPLPADADGLLKSRVFPGLWLDPAAFLRGNLKKLRAAVDRGTSSVDHVAFIAALATPGKRRARRPGR